MVLALPVLVSCCAKELRFVSTVAFVSVPGSIPASFWVLRLCNRTKTRSQALDMPVVSAAESRWLSTLNICNTGSYAGGSIWVSHGASVPPGPAGYITTIWLHSLPR